MKSPNIYTYQSSGAVRSWGATGYIANGLVGITERPSFWVILICTLTFLATMRSIEIGTDALLAFIGVLLTVVMSIGLYMFTRIMKKQERTDAVLLLFRLTLIEWGTAAGLDIHKLLPKDNNDA